MRALLAIDRLSILVGHLSAWLMVVLTALITWEVGSRYVFSAPHAWTFDAQLIVYGTLFMLAGAYTLVSSGHVRGDLLYGALAPRTQAAIDLVLYIAFFLPGITALAWAGYEFAAESWAIREHSSVMAEGPPIYPFKTVIPVAGALLLLQGAAEIARCVLCIRDGRWPARAGGASDVDVDALRSGRDVHQPGSEDAAAVARRRVR